MFMKTPIEEAPMDTTRDTSHDMNRHSTDQGGDAAAAHYKQPDWVTRHVVNKMLSGLTRMGVSVRGSRVLEHRGRTSGELHHTPVNPLTIDGRYYLVAPRGETQWVRNVRHADGHLVLILGRRRTHYTATEVPVSERIPILRAYLRRWKFETGMFFDGVTPDSSDEEWAAAAGRHPVFALS
jgi:F420H(2)-dependent quinone reductase